MSIKECKARARDVLIGNYGKCFLVYLLNSLITIALSLLTVAGIGFALYSAGLLNDLLRVRVAFSLIGVSVGVVFFFALLIITWIVTEFLQYGFCRFMMNIGKGQKCSVGNLFFGFRRGSGASRYLVHSLILTLLRLVLAMVIVLASVWGFSGTGVSITYRMSPMAELVRLVCAVAVVFISIRIMFMPYILADRTELKVSEAIKETGRLMRGRYLKGFWLTSFSFFFWEILSAICPPVNFWVVPYMLCTYVVFYLDAEGYDPRWINGTAYQVDADEQSGQTAQTAGAETGDDTASAAGGGNTAGAADSPGPEGRKETSGGESFETVLKAAAGISLGGSVNESAGAEGPGTGDALRAVPAVDAAESDPVAENDAGAAPGEAIPAGAIATEGAVTEDAAVSDLVTDGSGTVGEAADGGTDDGAAKAPAEEPEGE